MMNLIDETVQANDNLDSHEEEFKSISDQIEQLEKRIAAIQESQEDDETRQARLDEIQKAISERNENRDRYDDAVVRQMVECIKVFEGGRIQVIFGGGYMIEEQV